LARRAGCLLVDVVASAPVRAEGQPVSIWRPGRAEVLQGIERKPCGDAPCHIEYPDVTASCCIHLFHRRAIPVRRERRAAVIVHEWPEGPERLALPVEPH